MLYHLTEMASRFSIEPNLLLPLIIALGIAWQDLKTGRISNYLTFGAALAGLGYQIVSNSWGGLHAGLLGLAVGFILLLLPYILGGVGAGDVKALAALGTWLGPVLILHFFLYMAVCGGVIALGIICVGKLRWSRICSSISSVHTWVLCRPFKFAAATCPSPKSQGIPYGVAMALGMVLFLIRGV